MHVSVAFTQFDQQASPECDVSFESFETVNHFANQLIQLIQKLRFSALSHYYRIDVIHFNFY